SMLRDSPPISMEAEGHVMRQRGERDRAFVEGRRVENRELAALFRAAIDRGEKIAIALGGVGAARNEDRLGKSIASRNAVGCLRAGLEIAMGQGVESAGARCLDLRREISMAIGVEREALVEPREIGGKIVDLLAPELVARVGEIETPLMQARHHLLRVRRLAAQ